MEKLSKEELETLQGLQREFADAKLTLGELEVQKMQVLQKVDLLKKAFAEQEKQLVEKYGEKAVINIKTGEINGEDK